MESEYISFAKASKEAAFLRKLLIQEATGHTKVAGFNTILTSFYGESTFFDNVLHVPFLLLQGIQPQLYYREYCN